MWYKIPEVKNALYGLLIIFSLFGQAAYAACTGPDGAEGDVIYSSAAKQLQFCNGTNWVNTGATVQSVGGGGGQTLVGKDGEVLGQFLGVGTTDGTTSYGSNYAFYYYDSTYKTFSVAGGKGVWDRVGGEPSANASTYFSGPDCTGQVLGGSTNGWGYACTGAASCSYRLTNYSGTATTKSYSSVRATNGSCSNTSGSASARPGIARHNVCGFLGYTSAQAGFLPFCELQ